MFDLLSQMPSGMLAALAASIGLLVGSFLNVVILRLPLMIQHEWTAQSREWLNLDSNPQDSPPSLLAPGSHCPQCKTAIRFRDNIPIFSFLFLGGKCAHCNARISWRYPSVELLTAVATGYIVWHFGWGAEAIFAIALTWCLIALAGIDIDYQLLPDDIVLPMLWLGLGLSIFGVFTDPKSSIIGAIAGYLIFWIVFKIFLLLTGKEGMGYGDFKLLSLFGAWLGWQYLPQIVLLSTLVGSVFGIAIILIQKKGGDTKIPFGPYIALAGWLALLWGDEINQAYWNFAGL